jgi:sulfonate transport system substrate-binding protein
MAAAYIEPAIRVGGVPEHFNLPWHLGIESGAFEDAGIPVEWQDYATGTGAMLADLAERKLDVAILLTEGAALGLHRGMPVVATSLYTTTPLIWGVHVPPGLAAEAIDDLRGRRFAISRRGSGSHLMSLGLALERAWPIEQMEFVIVDDLPGAIAAFSAGRAEVFLWEHFTTEPQVEAGVFRRIDDFVAPWPAWVICVAASVWQSQRGRIDSLLGVVAKLAAKLSQRPDRSALIADRYGLRKAAVDEWLSRTAWVSGVESPERALAAASAMLRAAGALAK